MLRGRDLHPRPQGYEPCELLLLHPASAQSTTRVSRQQFLVRKRAQDDFGERDGGENCDRKKEESPIERDDKHAEAIGEEAERSKPEYGVEQKH